jgi:hypothetical protein
VERAIRRFSEDRFRPDATGWALHFLKPRRDNAAGRLAFARCDEYHLAGTEIVTAAC